MAASPHKNDKAHSTKKEFLAFISIPIGLVVIVAAVLIIPSLFAKPKYDFIYSYCPSYDCSSDYQVGSNGEVTATKVYNNYSSASPQLYYYDAAHNASRSIDLNSADAYRLNPSNVSPDGYTLIQGNSSGDGFLFWGDNGDYNWYLKNGLKKKKLNLVNNTYYEPVKFIGWVQK